MQEIRANKTPFVIRVKSRITDFVSRVYGSRDDKNPKTGTTILSIPPVYKKIRSTINQIFDQCLDIAGRSCGIMQGQTLLPSNGGTGIKLIIAKTALIIKIPRKTSRMGENVTK
jgi:hypothetical protein